MAVITMPARGIKRITWEVDDPAQVNRSRWTPKRQVVVLTDAPMWRAQVELATRKEDIDVFEWLAFLLRLRGAANTFRLRIVNKLQFAGVTIAVNGAGQTGFSLWTEGWGAAGTKLRAGQFVTVGDQLLGLEEDVVANSSGDAMLYFSHNLRTSPADNAPVEIYFPTVQMALPDGRRSWSVDPGQLYGFSFVCEEAV